VGNAFSWTWVPEDCPDVNAVVSPFDAGGRDAPPEAAGGDS
jgi:hypothetical protein